MARICSITSAWQAARSLGMTSDSCMAPSIPFRRDRSSPLPTKLQEKEQGSSHQTAPCEDPCLKCDVLTTFAGSARPGVPLAALRRRKRDATQEHRQLRGVDLDGRRLALG